jgi:ATP-dependent DNA helicase RecG
MEVEFIRHIINKGEGLTTEFKKASGSVASDAYETIVSFSNTVGGTLLLGVDDDGIIAGIDKTQKHKLLKDLVSAINAVDNIYPPLYLQPIAVDIDDETIIVLQVPVSSQVHNHKGEIYIREFESDINVTKNQEKVSELYKNKSSIFTESEIIQNLTMEDLDAKLFEKARNLIRSNRSDHPWLLVDDLTMLKEAVLWRKDFNSGKEGFTLAAALLFGKDTTIQSLLPAYKVEAMERRVNMDRWDDRATLRKNLIDTYLELKVFINKHLPEKFYTEGDQRIDLRDKVFREIVGNIVVHREYRSALATEVLIENNQLVATNPNKPHFSGPIDMDSFNPFAKNPNIRKFFTALGWTDEIGSGIRFTKKYLPLYVPNAEPLFIEDNVFKTIIPLAVVTLAPFANKWQNWLELSGEHMAHIEKSLAKITIDTSLKVADWEAVLLNLVPSWTEKGTKLSALDWPRNQAITEEDIKKVPGWTEKGTKLIHKKVRYLIAILSLTAEPISLDDLMSAIGYSNKKTFRDNYLKPLEQLQFITKTDLENLTSPDQQYKLTKMGMIFLGNSANDQSPITNH